VTVTATGIGFYQGVTWYDDSFAAVSTDLSYTFAMPEADVNLSADFQKASLVSSFTLGKYPQTVVEDSATLTALGLATDTDSDGYLEYGSDEYKKVDRLRLIPGLQVRFGQRHLRHGDGVLLQGRADPVAGPLRERKHDRPRDVREDPDQQLLLPGWSTTRTISGSTVYPNNYQYSTLRAMLNGYDGSAYSVDNFTGRGFLDVAFTEAEKAYIATTAVDNSAATTDSSSNSYACTNTSDRIFALSYQDLVNTNYGFNSSLLKLRRGPPRRPHRLRPGDRRLDVHRLLLLRERFLVVALAPFAGGSDYAWPVGADGALY
jgi:hypothetical protein